MNAQDAVKAAALSKLSTTKLRVSGLGGVNLDPSFQSTLAVFGGVGDTIAVAYVDEYGSVGGWWEKVGTGAYLPNKALELNDRIEIFVDADPPLVLVYRVVSQTAESSSMGFSSLEFEMYLETYRLLDLGRGIAESPYVNDRFGGVEQSRYPSPSDPDRVDIEIEVPLTLPVIRLMLNTVSNATEAETRPNNRVSLPSQPERPEPEQQKGGEAVRGSQAGERKINLED